ncbi:MAG: copper chaperone PCu(A)C [Streptosporangiaceae bacterium]
MPGPDLLPETGRPAGGTPARVTSGCGTPGPGTPRWAPGGRAGRMAAAACLIVLAGAGLTGCYAKASAAPSIELSTAVVPQPTVPGETTAYLVIRNNSGPDRLIRVRTSVGGRVTFRAPAGHGNLAMHTIPAISVPGHNVIRLVPNSVHLLITGARSLRDAKEITLRLVFAHAGTMSVIAQVTNPETGGSSYFLNS